MTDLHSHIARREDILARLRRVIVEDLHVDREPRDIDPDTPIFGTGLGLDSVDAVEIMVSLEDAFDISVPDDPRVRSAMRTLNTLIDFILVNGRAAAERAADVGAGPEAEGAS
jgi:acyl carrier protein